MVDDPTFPYRVAAGLAIFGVLGAIDLARNPENPKRLKEYIFLFSVTGAVMLYGLAHDRITFALSPEYFRVVKGLRAESFFPEVAELALMASWTAGLVIGLALLVANNPAERLPQLPYRRLAGYLGWPAVVSVAFAVASYVAVGIEPRWTIETLAIDEMPIERPGALAAVWAAHIGTYGGAVVGIALAVTGIRAERHAHAPNCRRHHQWRSFRPRA